MKKKFTLKERIKMAITIITNYKILGSIEVCERCGSSNIEVGANKTVLGEDGVSTYYAKYFCKKCGCSCIATEIWEDNALLEYKDKKGNVVKGENE